jgi:hypothetical protein
MPQLRVSSTFSARPVMGWPGRAQGPRTTVERGGEASKLKELTMHTHQKSSDPVATIGLDIGKNTFRLDKRGTIVMRVKVSRNQLVRRLVNLPPCLIGTVLHFTAPGPSPDGLTNSMNRTYRFSLSGSA